MDEKSWWKSKGCIGSLIVIIVAGLSTFGMVGAGGEITASSASITDWIIQIGVIVGGVTALIGRINAKSAITK